MSIQLDTSIKRGSATFDRVFDAWEWFAEHGFEQTDLAGQAFKHADGRTGVVQRLAGDNGDKPCTVSIR